MKGTKIIQMSISNIRFLDSLNYLPMPLAQLPKAFDLSVNLKKGYFPHLFNTEKNKEYVGPLPPHEYYNPNLMSKPERLIFFKWYDENKNTEFNMRKEIVEYCKNDVIILTKACLKFRNIILKDNNVCPFTEATTIASTCNLIFRRNFLKAETIGLIPKNGYRFTDIQSKIALQWLIWEEDQRKINIQHAGKQKEAIINNLKVDGFCEETNQVFEFHGCYYHGHPKCFSYRRDEPLEKNATDTLNSRYEATISKSARLRLFGYEVIEKWECEFREQLIDNPDMFYLNDHPILINLPLDPRDSFFGGRTENIVTYYKAMENEKIKYIDVCSLYPYVCKYGKFPIGHPEIIVGNDECMKQNLKTTDGLIKCSILPPTDLFIPVLPIKQNNKLIFTLCFTCSEEKNMDDCTHADNKRTLNGTWVIDEVVKALTKGYKIIEIHEIWKYSVQQYDKTSSKPGLFTDIMDKFLKIKQESSDWPKTCVNKELKQQYIEDFFERENIKLDENKICANPGKRSVAKLILNSFWGKFGQKENQTQTEIIKTPANFYTLMTDPNKEVHHILIINDETLVVNWKFKHDEIKPLKTVNVCVASYTTAQARLKLYSYLEKLENRVLYYDTDSIIFISKEGEYEPPLGNFIGDMTDELTSYGDGSFITEFASGGPKNYGYAVYSTKSQSQVATYLVLNNDKEGVKIITSNFVRNNQHNVITAPQIKTYR
ncbi:uncharacterized protein LOC129611502 [Condylostylus longicornis]|uniref:uncharacterized protein LOC129611502 n=1 Tax=Condylostylus longicornis TaxID=2530218 RepID=UPI00244E4216|nr:uncharacterized protein LOC129611502 [Condylostylus longicornis]